MGTPALTSSEQVCSASGADRYKPDLGGCCAGTTECEESRPTTDPDYCDKSNPNHGHSCWTHLVMCKDSCEAPAPPWRRSPGLRRSAPLTPAPTPSEMYD